MNEMRCEKIICIKKSPQINLFVAINIYLFLYTLRTKSQMCENMLEITKPEYSRIMYNCANATNY